MLPSLLGVRKVPGTGSGIPKVAPDVGLLFQALPGNPQLRIVFVLKAETGHRNSGACEGKRTVGRFGHCSMLQTQHLCRPGLPLPL